MPKKSDNTGKPAENSEKPISIEAESGDRTPVRHTVRAGTTAHNSVKTVRIGSYSGDRNSVRDSIRNSLRKAVIIPHDVPAEHCLYCNENVVPIIEVSKDNCTSITAMVLCILCLCPFAFCVYFCPCGLLAYYRCPGCGEVIRIQRLS